MNPMTEGIEEMPTIRIVSGIQNQTMPTAAPVNIEAEGTTPMRRVRTESSWPGSGSSRVGSSRVIEAMPST
jgi:hypothetical protein